jgi:Ca2+:H+ antiporter
MIWLLLLFVPVAIGVEVLVPDWHLLVFATSSIAILPLAAWMVWATEQLADRLGEGVGGLINATFGNAAALGAGLNDVVEASIAGSIIGNILLVLGAAMFAGGLLHSEQRFNPIAVRSQATMLTLAAIALIVPAAFEDATAGITPARLDYLSASVSVVLLVAYALFHVFALLTHSRIFTGFSDPARSEEAKPHTSAGRAVAVLTVATVGIAWMSEIMVGSIEPTTRELGLSHAFVGVFLVAILGNAAEHATAISAAWKNRMGLALSIAIGSSVQVALFVAPVLVLISFSIGLRPMDLAFPPGLVLMVIMSVLITYQVAGDGRSDWLKGMQLLATYLILGLT